MAESYGQSAAPETADESFGETIRGELRAAAQAPSRQPVVAHAIDDLADRVERVAHLTDRLEDKLAPVLAQGDHPSVEGPELLADRDGVEVANAIDSIGTRPLENVIRSLDVLLRRIEV